MPTNPPWHGTDEHRHHLGGGQQRLTYPPRHGTGVSTFRTEHDIIWEAVGNAYQPSAAWNCVF